MTDFSPTDADTAHLGAAARTCNVAEHIADLVRPLAAQANAIRLRLVNDEREEATASQLSAQQLLFELQCLEELSYRLGEAGQALQRVQEAAGDGPTRCPPMS